MTLHLLVHAFVRSGDLPPNWKAPSPLGDGDLSLVAGGGFDVLVSSVEPGASDSLFDDAERTQAAALAHHDLLCSLMEECDFLPVRLGIVYSSAETLERAVAEQKPLLDGAMALCSAAGEYTVKVSRRRAANAEKAARPVSGRDYLKARQRRAHQRRDDQVSSEQLGAALGDRLATLGRAVIADSVQNSPDAVAAFTMLSDRQLSTATLSGLELIRKEIDQQGYELQIRGPWPPYRFSQGEAA
ncbi:MAG: GvpL/GvpF family gas vesicle protein [Parvularculaceae bacterium]|nr:GvpL/GvpF family gas vesicle protein [Parvularculaceae bacterium]